MLVSMLVMLDPYDHYSVRLGLVWLLGEPGHYWIVWNGRPIVRRATPSC